jgi:rare lipoprotein A
MFYVKIRSQWARLHSSPRVVTIVVEPVFAPRILKNFAALAVVALVTCVSSCSHKHKTQPVANTPAPQARPHRTPAIPAPIGSTEEGIASWYGPPYHGRQAADGEIYDMEKMTAAHRTLPFNTWVRVTNMANGHTADVRITDRGPFVDGRIIDLSKAAARQLDLLGPGVGRVHLEVIHPPALPPALQTELAAAPAASVPLAPSVQPPSGHSPSTLSPAVPPSTPEVTAKAETPSASAASENEAPQSSIHAASVQSPSSPSLSNQVPSNQAAPRPSAGPTYAAVDLPALEPELYAVQIGAFSILENAQHVRDQFARYGNAQLVARQGNATLWRVLVGRFGTQTAAQDLANQLQSEVGHAIFVVRLDPQLQSH